MADTLYGSLAPATTDQDFSTHSLGPEIVLSADRVATGGRVYIPAGGRPSNCWWQLWATAGPTLLAQVNLNDPLLGSPPSAAWFEFGSAFFKNGGGTPTGQIAMTSGVSYTCNVFSGGVAGGQFVYTDPGTFPRVSGVISSSTGRFRTGGVQTDFAATPYGAFFFADVTVDVPAAGGSGVGWQRKVNRHCAYLQQKTVGGNANYVKRRPAVITALGAGNLVNLRVRHIGETYSNVDRKLDPDANTVSVYVSY